MTLQQRYQQATKEARWALGLTLLYVLVGVYVLIYQRRRKGQLVFLCGLNWPAFTCRLCLLWSRIG